MFERWLGIVANLIEVGTVCFTVVAFYKARADLVRFLRSRRVTVSERPWALVVTLGGGDITGQVHTFLQDQGLAAKVANVRTYTYGYVRRERINSIIKGLLQIKDELTQQGATEVHLFYKGPVTVAMALGVIFDNWVPVKVYEFAQGSYQLSLTLEKGLTKGLLQQGALSRSKSALLGGTTTPEGQG